MGYTAVVVCAVLLFVILAFVAGMFNSPAAVMLGTTGSPR